jgi:hypothetical protein
MVLRFKGTHHKHTLETAETTRTVEQAGQEVVKGAPLLGTAEPVREDAIAPKEGLLERFSNGVFRVGVDFFDLVEVVIPIYTWLRRGYRIQQEAREIRGATTSGERDLKSREKVRGVIFGTKDVRVVKDVNMSGVSKKAYERLSAITGILVQEMAPTRVIVPRKECPYMYSMGAHVICSPEDDSRWAANYVDHERLHSLQWLLKPQLRDQKSKSRLRKVVEEIGTTFQYHRGAEISADIDTKTPLWEVTLDTKNTTRYLAMGLTLVTVISAPFFPAAPAALAYPIVSLGIQALRVRNFREFYNKHGVDGLLMLYSNPTRDYELLRLPSHERRLREDGLLKSEGGLTEKGEKFIKEKALMVIPRFLERAKENRKDLLDE